MFWYFLLAHILGDYLLQPTWMLQEKRRFRGLFLHSLIHLMCLVIVTWPYRELLWPYLLLITIVHFTIDALKNAHSKRFPDQIVIPYLVDQLIHIAVLFIVTEIIIRNGQIQTGYLAPAWVLVFIFCLFATFVWGISERIFKHRDRDFLHVYRYHYWGRMLARGLLFGVLLVAGTALMPAAGISLLPYSEKRYQKQELITDLAVSTISSLSLFLILAWQSEWIRSYIGNSFNWM